ncbi:hypothetical protein [Sporisorium scitamineum]|uniref:Uncharacterized protein n=1 Tax=Sporisorium scitamineum TaxID=49012 RepID=A0A0F7RWG4_9BASI|nr:hypothetical protein [Sporisorium scitamineum]
MLRFTTLIQALLIAVSVAPVAQTYLISNKVVIWNEWQPFPEAEEHLKQLVINASISKSRGVTELHCDLTLTISRDPAYRCLSSILQRHGKERSILAEPQGSLLFAAIAGEKANRPMSGTEWNIWYTDIVKRRYEAENQAIAASAGRAR